MFKKTRNRRVDIVRELTSPRATWLTASWFFFKLSCKPTDNCAVFGQFRSLSIRGNIHTYSNSGENRDYNTRCPSAIVITLQSGLDQSGNGLESTRHTVTGKYRNSDSKNRCYIYTGCRNYQTLNLSLHSKPKRCKKGVILYLRQANHWSCWRPQKRIKPV